MHVALDAMMPKKTDQKAKVEKTTTKIEVDLLRRANIVALHKKMDLFDYLDGILRQVVDRDTEQMYADFCRTKGKHKETS